MDAITGAADLTIGALCSRAVSKARIQPMGTETVRPSSRSTESVSSVIVTFRILANVTTAEFVPFISQQLQILVHDTLNVAQLFPAVIEAIRPDSQSSRHTRWGL